MELVVVVMASLSALSFRVFEIWVTWSRIEWKYVIKLRTSVKLLLSGLLKVV